MTAHGTRACYQSGCKRPECNEANNAYLRGRPRKRPAPAPFDIRHPDYGATHLDVECWCQTKVIRVPADMVRACLTDTCGAPNCHPMAATA